MIRRVIVGLIITAAILLPGLYERSDAMEKGEPSECTEDMDCWNCETMGNRVCGPLPPKAVETEPSYTG